MSGWVYAFLHRPIVENKCDHEDLAYTQNPQLLNGIFTEKQLRQ